MSLKLIAESEFPCIQNNLLDEESGELIAAVYLSSDIELPKGLYMSTEGFYEMVFDKNAVTHNDVLLALTELTELTGIEYEL
jgi:hypothetical protein